MKVYSRFHGLPSNRQNPFNITLHQGQKLKRWQLLHKKALFVKPIFTYGTLDPFEHCTIHSQHCTILGRNYIYSHLVHSRRVHILGHTTRCNVALDQCLCSKTAVMVFCVSKVHKSLRGSLTYQILKMNTVHPQARLEFQLLEGTVDRYGRYDWHIGRILLDCQADLTSLLV